MISLTSFLIPSNKLLKFSDLSTTWKDISPINNPNQGINAFETENLDPLSIAQEKLYASDSHALLLILEGLSGCGIEEIIRRVLTTMNPQGCNVQIFQKPSDEELGHSFLWRYSNALPERGRICVFKHSYYDEVVPWVQVENIKPGEASSDNTSGRMCQEINAFEMHLTNHSTKVVKVFFNNSKEEQRKRFLEMLSNETVRWKFSKAYLADRNEWEVLHSAWENIINQTNTSEAPWFIIPSDNLLTLEMLIKELLIQSISDLGVDYPEVPPEELAKFEESKKRLLAEN